MLVVSRTASRAHVYFMHFLDWGQLRRHYGSLNMYQIYSFFSTELPGY